MILFPVHNQDWFGVRGMSKTTCISDQVHSTEVFRGYLPKNLKISICNYIRASGIAYHMPIMNAEKSNYLLIKKVPVW